MTHNVYHFVRNEDKPTTAYVTDKAVKAGKANAASGKIFVTVPPDHFGPIPAENDPDRHRGVRVGDTWDDRMECRQWGAHIPHVAGIAGQSSYGAQSVALSGGYQDDEDHGEWFLYTGRYCFLVNGFCFIARNFQLCSRITCMCSSKCQTTSWFLYLLDGLFFIYILFMLASIRASKHADLGFKIDELNDLYKLSSSNNRHQTCNSTSFC